VKTVTILMRKAPYGSVYSAEGYRAIMGLGVFEMDVQVVFVDDGVFVLKKSQDPDDLDMKPLGSGFPMLTEFDVNKFYVHGPSLEKRGLTPDDLVMDVKVMSDLDVAEALGNSSAILPF
jgi:tRNA 2-thiouridine synthesizing protein C